MFCPVKNNTLLWFEKCPLECGVNYELIGIILGLSIYNNVNLDLKFPIVVYKKLMGIKTEIDVFTFKIGFI